jgi:ABC-type sugar transport system ATPase subunit
VEAMTMADRIAVMNKGYVQQLDTPQTLYDYPANLFVAGFIGSPSMNFFNAKIKVEGDKAYVFYFTHPGRDSHPHSPLSNIGNQAYELRRSVIQCGELVFKDGTLECNHEAGFDFYLPNMNNKINKKNK